MVDANGLRFHVRDEGSGTPVILLHGFPDTGDLWRHQVPALVGGGFRTIVPDMRGRGRSSRPAAVEDYRLSAIVRDVTGILDALEVARAHVVGHDWGAAVAWSAALSHPERVAKLAILNVPHPSVMRRYLMSNRRQLRRSWYMFFFQLPFLPEALFSANNFRMGASALKNSSRAGTFTAEDLTQYRAAWSRPGAVTAMIHWYRAAFRFRAHFADRTVRVPTRILWGERDRFLLFEMAEASLRYCSDGEVISFPEASHWLQHEEPARVSELLIEFFRRN